LPRRARGDVGVWWRVEAVDAVDAVDAGRAPSFRAMDEVSEIVAQGRVAHGRVAPTGARRRARAMTSDVRGVSQDFA